MAKVFIHIGYPKCLSTTLQRSLFEKHPDINYFGIGIGDNISYVSPDIEFIFEILLKYSRRDFYEAHFPAARAAIQSALVEDRPNVISSEQLVMNSSLQGIDPMDKIIRLAELFAGAEAEIILVHRETKCLIRSLYGEMVKMGYFGTFEEFELWIMKFRDRNFYNDLDVEAVTARVKKKFPIVHLLSFDDLISNVGTNVNREFARIFNVRDMQLPIAHHNPSLNSEELEALRMLNLESHREIGESALTAFEHHRNRTLFPRLGLNFKGEYVFRNVIQKREALGRIRGRDNSSSPRA